MLLEVLFRKHGVRHAVVVSGPTRHSLRLHEVVLHLMVNHDGLGQLLALESRLRIPPVHELLLVVHHFHEYVFVGSSGLGSQFADRAKCRELPYRILQSCKRLLRTIRIVLLLKFHLRVLGSAPLVRNNAWIGGLLRIAAFLLFQVEDVVVGVIIDGLHTAWDHFYRLVAVSEVRVRSFTGVV